ncbi:MAG TPA: hypothetical protein DCY80_09015 [Solibacterales bacterium]|nr:hypothetical protein [Bryobacterales bacterium]
MGRVMKTIGEADILLTTYQVARWLGYSVRTICYWAECSHLPAIKVGRQWRFRRAEIGAWLQRREQAVPTTSPESSKGPTTLGPGHCNSPYHGAEDKEGTS